MSAADRVIVSGPYADCGHRYGLPEEELEVELPDGKAVTVAYSWYSRYTPGSDVEHPEPDEIEYSIRRPADYEPDDRDVAAIRTAILYHERQTYE